MSGTIDLCKGINRAWDASSLEATFKSYWNDPTESEFYVFNDQEAPAEQPSPYVVMGQPMQGPPSRQSGGGVATKKRETRDVEINFNVHVEIDADGAYSAKELAGDLAGKIMAVFGGHPTISPTAVIALDNGEHLITQYQNDYGIKTGNDEYQWVIVYLFRIDVPVAV